LLGALVAVGCGCGASSGAPPEGWANAAPTTVQTVVDRGAHQLLEVRQGALTTWVQVPAVGARVGDHVLLGRGTARANVAIPERSLRAPEVVDIDHVKVVDAETALFRARFAKLAPDQVKFFNERHNMTLTPVSDAEKAEHLGPLRALFEHPELHSRLLNGSDYPLPAINALLQTGAIVQAGFLTEAERTVLNEIDQHDPLLFDFVTKRTLHLGEVHFPDSVFMPTVFSRLQ
jgi:hypothetical protein